ncbi:MAG TPA: YhjD/YihY/BrkB family envelope integrity protein, partial [Vicinamibacteria bacterium]|nr:YhjD/YihY/BrkB family envelope integrity protein [Vicinamibacteria bacterium]
GIGFLLLVSLVLSAGLAAFGKYAGGALPGWTEVLQALNVLLGFGFTALLFGMMFKVLPDVDLRWRDVALGAVITAGLFTLGRVLIGLYLGRSSVGSAYGAAGSLAIMLLWVYYSSQIMLLGAEFTQVHARWRGTWVQPMAHAEVKPGAHKGTVHPRAQGDESRPRREDAGGTSSPAEG